MSISKMLLQKNLGDKILFLLKILKPEERTLVKLVEHLNPILANRIYEINEMEPDKEKFKTPKEFNKYTKSLKEGILSKLRATMPMILEKLKELEKKGLISSIDHTGFSFEEHYIWSLNDKQGKYEMKLMNLSYEAFELLNVRTYEEMEKVVKKELKKKGIEDRYSTELTDDRFWEQELFREATELWKSFDYYIETYNIIKTNSEKLIKVYLKEIEKGKEEQTSIAMSILIGELFHEAYENNLKKIEKKLEELKKEVKK